MTCEHAGRDVPREFRALFRGHGELLRSHRGWDIGALALTEHLARAAGVRARMVTVSRLVIDVNRSVGNRSLFSELMRGVSEEERARIVEAYYRPHREEVERAIAARVKRGGRGGRALHVSVHTFTPVLNGRKRDVDVGVLFDPSRRWERELANAWVEEMKRLAPGLRVKRNLPYRGTSDGFTTYMRTRFAATRYAGIEIELSNRIASGEAGAAARREAFEVIARGMAGLRRSQRRAVAPVGGFEMQSRGAGQRP